MIKIVYTPDRSGSPIDPCVRMMHQIEESDAFRAVFFMCGVSQQLLNLDILSESQNIGELSGDILPCWHRVYDSGYRPDKNEIEMFRIVSLMDNEVTKQMLDHFMMWYGRYLKSDFFGPCRYMRTNEHN